MYSSYWSENQSRPIAFGFELSHIKSVSSLLTDYFVVVRDTTGSSEDEHSLANQCFKFHYVGFVIAMLFELARFCLNEIDVPAMAWNGRNSRSCSLPGL